MPIRRGVSCYYVNEQHRVLEAEAVTDEQRDGSITIKFSPAFNLVSVRAVNVFLTKAAADRSAAIRTSSNGSGPPTLGTFIR